MLGLAFSSIGFGTVSGCWRGRGGSGSTGGTISTEALGVTSAGATTNSETGFTTDLDSVGNASGTRTFSGAACGVVAAGSALAASMDSTGAADGFSGSILTGVEVRGFAFVLLTLVLCIDGADGAPLVTRACKDALKPPNICDARLGPPPLESPNKTTNSTCNNIDKITNLPTSTCSRGAPSSGATANRRNG